MPILNISNTTPLSFAKQRPILFSFTILSLALAIIGALALGNVGSLKELSRIAKITMLSGGACLSGILVCGGMLLYRYQVIEVNETMQQQGDAIKERLAPPCIFDVPPEPPSPPPPPTQLKTPQPERTSSCRNGNMPDDLPMPLVKEVNLKPSVVFPATAPPPKVTPIIVQPTVSICTPIIQKPIITADTDYDDCVEEGIARELSSFGYPRKGYEVQFLFKFWNPATDPSSEHYPHYANGSLSSSMNDLYNYLNDSALGRYKDARIVGIFYSDSIHKSINLLNYRNVFPNPTFRELDLRDGRIIVEISTSPPQNSSQSQIITTEDAPKVE